MIDGTRSEATVLNFGVPQGSVLGPILFTVYTTPLGSIVRKYGLSYHMYADDTQLYISFRPSDVTSTNSVIKSIESCYLEIKDWMKNNLLKLNDDKTELLIATEKKYKSLHSIHNIRLDGTTISPQSSVRNLGVIFNSILDVEAFVNAKCKATRNILRNISRVRTSLTADSTKTIVNAYVMSKLDYCNSLLLGAPSSMIDRLQKVQNYAARVVSMTRRRDHITPVLADLHWLPVEQRIVFKTCLHVYKCLNGISPKYLSDLLNPYKPERNLRSSHLNLLTEYPFRLDAYGGRAFAIAAPKLWKQIPVDVRLSDSVSTFKKKLKTFLFRKYFH